MGVFQPGRLTYLTVVVERMSRFALREREKD
jgi:hypothetical protein